MSTSPSTSEYNGEHHSENHRGYIAGPPTNHPTGYRLLLCKIYQIVTGMELVINLQCETVTSPFFSPAKVSLNKMTSALILPVLV